MIRDLFILGLTFVAAIWTGRTASAQAVAPRPVAQRQARPTQQRQVPVRQQQRGQAIRSQPSAQPVIRQAGGALAPNWIPLSPEHEQRLDQTLRYWEASTSGIQRYRCRFRCWEYEPAVAFREPDPKTYKEGVIKFAEPDKGLFRVEQVQHSRRSQVQGSKLQWVAQNEGHREHWVCDGKSIYEFDYQTKQLKQRTLPPDMQGQQITEGPLPFMFGAKADRIRQRFWVRPIWPEGVKNEYWLELIPKTREDAANFRKLKIVIAEEDFLPKGMILYYRNGAQTNFVFEGRETNWNMLAQQLIPWHREFHQPKTPSGWKKVVEPIRTESTVVPPSGSRQAQRRPLTIQPR